MLAYPYTVQQAVVGILKVIVTNEKMCPEVWKTRDEAIQLGSPVSWCSNAHQATRILLCGMDLTYLFAFFAAFICLTSLISPVSTLNFLS